MLENFVSKIYFKNVTYRFEHFVALILFLKSFQKPNYIFDIKSHKYTCHQHIWNVFNPYLIWWEESRLFFFKITFDFLTFVNHI
jgi:hypothetical protein